MKHVTLSSGCLNWALTEEIESESAKTNAIAATLFHISWFLLVRRTVRCCRTPRVQIWKDLVGLKQKGGERNRAALLPYTSQSWDVLITSSSRGTDVSTQFLKKYKVFDEPTTSDADNSIQSANMISMIALT